MTQNLSKLQNFHALKSERLKPVIFDELFPFRPREFVVEGILSSGAMSVFFGPSNSGKTFLLLDIALHVALGWDWCGKKTKQAAVVYIAAEGGRGVAERVQAFKTYYGVSGLPFYLISATVNFLDKNGDVNHLIEQILPIPNVSLVVIDTLSRAFGGGNENSSEDMGTFIINCDRIRAEIGTHVAVVHHSGKSGDKGARGHSSLKSATDTEIEVTQQKGIINFSVNKQRDSENGETLSFKLHTVTTPLANNAPNSLSCVILRTDVAIKKREAMRPSATKLLLALKLGIDEFGVLRPSVSEISKSITIEEFREIHRKSGITSSETGNTVRTSFRRAKSDLLKLNIIAEQDEYIYMKDNGTIEGTFYNCPEEEGTGQDKTRKGCPESQEE